MLIRASRARLALGLALAALTSLLTLMIPGWVGRLSDEINGPAILLGAGMSGTLTQALLFVGLLVGRTVCGFLSSYALGTAAARTVTHLRQDLYNRFLYAPIAFHDRQPSAGLIAALTADAGFVEQSLNAALPAVAQHLPVILLGTLLAYLTNPTLTAMLIVVSVPFILIVGLAGQRVRWIAQQGQDVLAHAAVAGQEGLLGLRFIKGLGREGWAVKRFNELLDQLLDFKRRRVLWMSLLETALPLGAIIGVLTVAWLVRQQLADNTMTRAGFVTFVSYLAIIAASARPLLSAYTGVESMLGAADRLSRLTHELGAPEDVQAGKPLPLLCLHPDALTGGGAIAFHQVSFTFGGEATQPHEPFRGVRQLSLNLEAGEVVSITGHNGAGKSTVAQLLLRFYPPDQGSITLDGVSANLVALADWRRRFALVSRDPVIFGVSIFENLQLGRPTATMADIEQVAKAVGLHAFISSLPQGYQTQVGEAGVRLSAGQRQRIALARVFLQDPAVVVLDEATHSLDAESEALFWAALMAWKRNRTLIVISHQPIDGLPLTRVIHMAHGHILSNTVLRVDASPAAMMS